MNDTVLLAVDIQKLITNDSLYNFDIFCNNVSLLMAEARKHDIEVIYVRHDDGEGNPLSSGQYGFEIHESFAAAEGEKIFDKRVNSPFRDSGLLEYLCRKDIKRIITVGLQTDFCIDATVKCGFEHGFDMIVPEYCNSTFDNEYMTAEETYRFYNEFMWKNRYADCVTMDKVLDLIRRR